MQIIKTNIPTACIHEYTTGNLSTCFGDEAKAYIHT